MRKTKLRSVYRVRLGVLKKNGNLNRNHSTPMQPLILIGGASGSGKSTFAERFASYLRTSTPITFIRFDDYYANMPPGTRHADWNFDHPNSFDFNILRENIRDAISGKPFDAPVYCLKTSSRLAKTTARTPNGPVLLEGVFALYDEEIRSMASLAIFVSTSIEECLSRRIERDVRERNREKDAVIAQWQKTVAPMYHEYVAPTEEHAHISICGTSNFDEQLRAVSSFLPHIPNFSYPLFEQENSSK